MDDWKVPLIYGNHHMYIYFKYGKLKQKILAGITIDTVIDIIHMK